MPDTGGGGGGFLGGVIGGLVGGLFGGGRDPDSLTRTEKERLILEAARQYGTDSPEYKLFVHKWPKAARAVAKYGGALPRSLPPPTAAQAALQPIIFTDVTRGRGYTRGDPPTGGQLLGAGEILASLYGLGGGLRGGASLLKSLFRRRGLRKEVSAVLKETPRARSKRIYKRAQRGEGIEARVGPKDVKPGKQTGPGGVVATKDATKTKAKLTEAAAGTAAAAVVADIIVRNIKSGSTVGPGAQPGSGNTVGNEANRNSTAGSETPPASVPTGSQTTRPGSTPGTSSQPGATRVSARVARSSSGTRSGALFGSTPWWQKLGLPTGGELLTAAALATLTKARARRPLNFNFPSANPQTQTAGLTAFGSGGVGSRTCECPPKRKSKRKPRTVCYTGRFSESATGTLKYDKRKRTSCQPSRKKQASPRAQ